ncbi:hypothetical protein CAJAP_07495 [Camponotus japonicus]
MAHLSKYELLGIG